VAIEIRAYGDQDPTARALAAHDWLEVRPVEQVAPEILAWDLGPGESAVLELARALPGSTALIDDLAGRRCAEALGLLLRGTVGLVLAAKLIGRLAAARPVLERLRDTGMYLSDAVLQRALTLFHWLLEAYTDPEVAVPCEFIVCTLISGEIYAKVEFEPASAV
jgi:predicted nucleic acid-binding protein